MNDSCILVVCLNPTLQKTIVLRNLRENEVNRSSEYRLDAAGKGVNTARVLGQLGERARHLTQAGGWNRDIYLSLADEGFVNDWVESGTEVRFCYTVIDRSKSTVTEIVEEGGKASPGTEERVFARYLELLGEARAVIISGSKAAGFSDELFPEMTLRAKKAGLPVCLDYRGKDLLGSLPARPDIIKPNFEEFVSTFFPGYVQGNPSVRNPVPGTSPGFPAEEGEDTGLEIEVMKKMEEVSRAYGSIVVVTRGSRGVLYTAGSAVEVLPIQPVLPVNTIGSGDAFTAGLFSSWLANGNLPEAVRKGAECGRLNALLLKPGTIRG